MKLWCLALHLWMVSQGHRDGDEEQQLFALRGDGVNRRVSCEQAGVSPGKALPALCNVLGWRLVWQDEPTAALFREGALQLSFQGRDPAWVVELLAIACGADVWFDRDDARGVTVTVVPCPRPETQAGRRRLREQAIRWYGNALDLSVAGGELGKDLEPKVRIQMARLTQLQGDFLAAAREYERFRTSDRGNPLVPGAVLEAARCYFALRRYREARELAEDLSLRVTDEPAGAAAAVLLGRILIVEKRYADAVRAMDLRSAIYERTPQRNALVLLMADAYRLLQRPDQVLASCATLHGDAHGRLDQDDELFQLFLVGHALHASPRPEDAVTMLSGFLRGALDHPYRGEGLLAFAVAAAAIGRDLDAISAARAARAIEGLTVEQQERLAVVEGKAQVRLEMPGSRERLEAELRRIGPTVVPDLTLFLGTAYLEAGHLEKAKVVLALLAEAPGPIADAARYLTLEAWARQGLPEEVVARSIVALRAIQDPRVQSRVSTLVGDSYLMLKRFDEAAEAYRGRIR